MIQQLERKVHENKTMLGALKNELLIELHERLSQHHTQLEQDVKRRTSEVH